MGGSEHTEPYDPAAAFIVAIIGVLILASVFFVPWWLDDSWYGTSTAAYPVAKYQRYQPAAPAPDVPVGIPVRPIVLSPAGVPVAASVAASVGADAPDLSGLRAV